MFIKLSLLSLVTPLVAGLTLKVSDKPMSGGAVTVSWTTAPGDPSTFSLELINQVFHNAFAIANNVIPEQGSIDLILPVVPIGSGYTLNAVDIGNINNVYASTGSFAIGGTSSSTAATTSGASTTSSGTGLTTSGGSTVSVSASTRTPLSSPSFGSTRSNAASATGTGGASGGSGTGGNPAATSNAAVSALKINMNMGGVAAVLFSAVAGAVIVAL